MHLHIISRADAKRAGLKYYFTGNPCKHGHASLRYVSVGSCVECALSDESIRQRMAWKIDNIEIILDSARKYHAENRERRNAEARNRYKLNREKAAARKRIYSIKNAGVIRQKNREYRANNKEKIRQCCRNSRARRNGANGLHTNKDILLILESQKNKCVNCLCDVSAGYHVDHIMPLKLGGNNWPQNLQILCPTCNLRKSAKHPIDWAQENGRLL